MAVDSKKTPTSLHVLFPELADNSVLLLRGGADEVSEDFLLGRHVPVLHVLYRTKITK